MLPVVRAVDLMCSHSMHVDDMHRSRDLVNKDKWSNATEQLLQLCRQDDHIVLTDRSELQNVGVLIL